MELETAKPHLQYIDCLRGYAVIMVITVHLTNAIAELPDHLARFGRLGWYGVQLFFLMSSFTLLSSWNAEKCKYGEVNAESFFIRRFLRIAPAYYFAVALYLLLAPPSRFDLGQLLATVSFTNAWHPVTMPDLPGWEVVPGQWSIGVEFSFYLVFPVLASFVTSLSRSLIAFIVAFCGAIAFNFAAGYLYARTPEVALANFRYFWLPNQLSIFTLGMVLYYLIGDGGALSIRILNVVRPIRYTICFIAIALFLSATFAPLSHFIGQSFRVPETIFATLPFMLFATSLASGPTLLVNSTVQAIGKVSFSAYLLHFAQLDMMRHYPGVFGFRATNYVAIGYYVLDWLFLILATFVAAYLLYILVELPGMRFAKKITQRAHLHRIVRGNW